MYSRSPMNPMTALHMPTASAWCSSPSVVRELATGAALYSIAERKCTPGPSARTMPCFVCGRRPGKLIMSKSCLVSAKKSCLISTVALATVPASPVARARFSCSCSLCRTGIASKRRSCSSTSSLTPSDADSSRTARIASPSADRSASSAFRATARIRSCRSRALCASGPLYLRVIRRTGA